MAIFSQDLFDAICERIRNGESLNAICRDRDMPSRQAVFGWLGNDPALLDKYVRVREIAAYATADDIADISDRTLAGEIDPIVARAAIDAKKWDAARKNMKRFGDKMAVGGADDLPPVKIEQNDGVSRLMDYLDGIAERSGTAGETDA